MSLCFKKIKFDFDFLLNEDTVTSVTNLSKYRPEQIVTPELIDLVTSLGIVPANCIIIPYKGISEPSTIHVDDFDIVDQANLNFVIDWGNAYTNWYEKDQDYEPYIRPNLVGAKTYSYDPNKVQVIESTHIVGSCLFQGGVPHNVSNILKDRWCVSIKLRHHDWTAVTWEQTNSLFAKYLN